MKILVTGADGQLGFDVCRVLGDNAVGATIKDFNLTCRNAVVTYIERLKPDAIIHSAAYTAVDKAESEPELCHAVNALGTRYVAEAAAGIGAKMAYISTDYVFDGQKDGLYETDDTVNPLGVYGRSKLEGENTVEAVMEKYFIVRTTWVFGQNGGNFVKTMLRVGRERGEARVIDDQAGSPTYTPDLAVLLSEMIQTERYGVYHATNEGFCSPYGFAREIFKTAGMDVRVTPITTAEYPTAAKRPQNSRLSKESLVKAGFQLLPDWKDALKRFL